MARLAETKLLARAIRNHASKAVRLEGLRLYEGIVRQVNPLKVELTTHDVTLEESDLLLGSWVRRYDVIWGLAVNDALVLMLLASGDWYVADVLTQNTVQSKPPTRTILTTASVSPYVPPAGCIAFDVEAIGAGGGGGGTVTAAASGAAGGGGGGGAWARKRYSGTLKASYVFSVGAGGAGGSTAGGVGVTGGDSSFDGGTTLAKGGGGGPGGNIATSGTAIKLPGVGGPASTSVGDEVKGGSPGAPSVRLSASILFSGEGGMAPSGGGGGYPNGGSGTPPAPPGYGGGGAGGVVSSGSAAVVGGSAADGVIEITEYY